MPGVLAVVVTVVVDGGIVVKFGSAFVGNRLQFDEGKNCMSSRPISPKPAPFTAIY